MTRRLRLMHFLPLHDYSFKPNVRTNLIHIATLPLSIPTADSKNSFVANYCSCIRRSLGQGENEDFVQPDEYAISNALKVASFNKCPNLAQRVHALVIKLGFSQFTVLMTALTDFNLKWGNLNDARRLFNEMPQRDVVSWTSMIVGCARHQHYEDSLDLFRMMIASGITPNAYSFSGVMSACFGDQAHRQGQQIHAHVLTSGFFGADVVIQNSLLHMYTRCLGVSCARKLFDSMMTIGGNNIAWNEMISGYVQCGDGEEALKLFVLMISQGVKPDDFSYSICADACASLASMQQGSQIHSCILKSGFYSDIIIRNSLVNMYAKCGCVDSAKLVFDEKRSRDTLLWTALISAYGKNGMVVEVLAMFEQMRGLNIKPDEITYLAVLSACSYGGLVDQGWLYFRLMTEESLVRTGPEHYTCMVDLLCRGGYLLQALDFIKQMPLKPNINIWSTFLSSCKLYGNTELAKFAAEQLLHLDPENSNEFVILSNMYAAGCGWDEIEEIRERMRSNNVKKEPGCSWVELKTGYHVFLTANRSHPEMDMILLTLKGLMNTCCKEEHYL